MLYCRELDCHNTSEKAASVMVTEVVAVFFALFEEACHRATHHQLAASGAVRPCPMHGTRPCQSVVWHRSYQSVVCDLVCQLFGADV